MKRATDPLAQASRSDPSGRKVNPNGLRLGGQAGRADDLDDLLKALAAWAAIVVVILISCCAVFCILAARAMAEPPSGADLSSPTHAWFEHQHSVTGAWCCDMADGFVLSDADWRHAGDHYEVRIDGKWCPIPADALRDPRGGHNPTGAAIVWYRHAGEDLRIFCFTPGFEY